jgi:hydrogenase-4 component B
MILLIIDLIISVVSSVFAVDSLLGNSIEYTLNGGYILGNISIRLDSLSALIILIINFTVLNGVLYGRKYLEHYNTSRANLNIHKILIIIFHCSMLLVCVVQHFLAFLAVWEIMAISSFLLVIFEHDKKENIKAGINYFIQSHIGVLFLTVAFIWIISGTGSFDFLAINSFSRSLTPESAIVLFILVFVGFGFKAGFIPFHTWLPYAHPAAPSHISGMMSGVIIKLGIFMILRSILLINCDYIVIGEIILVVSVLSGLYGVMLAIVQHNLKKLLAYHSIENIGIIGIGIGIGTIGMGMHNDFLAITGFSGALLHVLNHSLFKSLLFYTAGSVYQQTGTLNIEKLGGLIKRMPQTSVLFLIASLAICGLPPFNGFISEFLIYTGLFSGLSYDNFSFSLFILLVIISLVLIGGLALLCFTKAFGVVFLGTERHHYYKEPEEVPASMLLPQYLIALLIVLIGLFPHLFMQMTSAPVSLFVPSVKTAGFTVLSAQLDIMSNIGIAGNIIIGLSVFIYTLKKIATRKATVSTSSTWGCGYTAPNARMQYTAGSFVKSYSNLVKPLIIMKKKETEITDIFPGEHTYESIAYDKIEYYLVDKNLKLFKKLLYKFDFLQNGRIPYYISYGLLFIVLIILLSYGENFINLLQNIT